MCRHELGYNSARVIIVTYRRRRLQPVKAATVGKRSSRVEVDGCTGGGQQPQSLTCHTPTRQQRTLSGDRIRADVPPLLSTLVLQCSTTAPDVLVQRRALVCGKYGVEHTRKRFKTARPQTAPPDSSLLIRPALCTLISHITLLSFQVHPTAACTPYACSFLCMSLLICWMALPGLRCLGQTLEQFMIVWQR